MKVVESVDAVRSWRAEQSGTVGFVPTMGALHEGHRSLLREARTRCDRVAASIFVNPTQFGPHEDLDRYPRTREADEAVLREEGVDFVWFGTPADVYPDGFATEVHLPRLARRLCGVSRHQHFSGVATIVLKLFLMFRPHAACFGKKDYQQWVIIDRMVRDLGLGVDVVPCPIVREEDGLALSSRNVHLSKAGRQSALALRRGLGAALERVNAGEREVAKLLSVAASVITEQPAVRLEYLELVDSRALEPIETLTVPSVLAVAAHVDGVRLIDNIELLGTGESA